VGFGGGDEAGNGDFFPDQYVDGAELVGPLAAQVLPAFSEAHFLASVKSTRISTGGDMEITLSIPHSEKYRAITLTDAIGIMVVIHAERKRRGGT
jgi:hypothetical protein